jgi:hypothetical protein
MSFFSRVFKKPVPAAPIQPDDSHLRQELKEAKKENSTAVAGFVKAANKQERDAKFARHVISDVLIRAERARVQDATPTK